MTPLMPCPRCTQALPVTAAFCRRCGLPVRPPVAVPTAGPAAGAGARRGVGRRLLGVGIMALVVGLAVMRMSVHRQSGHDAEQQQPEHRDGEAAATGPGQQSNADAPADAVDGPVDRPVDHPVGPDQQTAVRHVYPLSSPSHYRPSLEAPPGYAGDGPPEHRR